MMGVQISIEKLATIYYVKVNTSSLCHHLCVSFGSEEHKGKMGHFNDNFDSNLLLLYQICYFLM